MDDMFELDDLFADDPELKELLRGVLAEQKPPPAPAPETDITDITQPTQPQTPQNEPAGDEQPPPNAFQIPDRAKTPAPENPNSEFSPRAADCEPPNSELTRSSAKKFFRIFSNAVYWLVVISLVGGSILFAVSNDPKKAYFGYRFYSVLTESMTPKADGTSPPGGFNKGDIIIVKLCEAETIQEGDIITFNPNVNKPDAKAYLTHRVVEVLDGLEGYEGIFFRTRGDHNNADDPPINGGQLIGKKVLVIPKMGGILQSLRNNFILAIALVVCFFASIFMFKWYFAKPKAGIRD